MMTSNLGRMHVAMAAIQIIFIIMALITDEIVIGLLSHRIHHRIGNDI